MDVDVDFDTKLGPLVFKHINEKYGNENCSNIITFLRMQPKVIIKDIARCLNIESKEVNDYTSSLPDDLNNEPLNFDNLFKHPEYGKFFEKYPLIKKFCKYYEDLPRSTGQHAAGIGIASVPIKDVSPVILSKDSDTEKMYLSVFEKEDYEHFGLIKFDILKLKNIRQVRDVLIMVNKLNHTNLTEKDIPFDDEKTWNLINETDTKGMFQFGDALGKKVIKQVHPDNIEELSACNAFIRPGASGIDNYVNGKSGLSTVKYDPRIDKILEKTYGSIVFQEQIMALISELIGVSFGKADIYRRALEKPKKGKNAELIKQFNDDVKIKAPERGYDPNVAEQIKNLIIENSGYGFNKCLSGEEKLYGRTLTIKEMFNKKHFGKGYSMKKNNIIKNDVVDVTYSGYLDTYSVITENNCIVRCTLNHKFPTADGIKLLAQLKVGDDIYTHKNNQLQESTIKEIIYYGKEDTYNVEMQHPYHTIVLDNGIVVCNSHAVCYSIVGYQTAWCKANFPEAFYAVMINDCADTEVANFLFEAQKKGIKILPPDVNKSELESSIENGAIRIGFNILKGIGSASIDSIINNRPYKTLEEFLNSGLNKTTIEVLINTNALDNLPLCKDNDIKLNALQIKTLLSKLGETKVATNYAVPMIKIKNDILNTYDFVQERNGTVIIPADCLEELQINLKDCQTTKGKPKGFLAERSNNNSFLNYAFKQHKEEILAIVDNKTNKYLRSLPYLNFPIAEHPLKQMEEEHPHLNTEYIENIADKTLIDICGIIGDKEEKTTKKNTIYYVYDLITPREVIKMTVWGHQNNKYNNVLVKNMGVIIQGEKSYGGITLKQIVSYGKISN